MVELVALITELLIEYPALTKVNPIADVYDTDATAVNVTLYVICPFAC